MENMYAVGRQIKIMRECEESLRNLRDRLYRCISGHWLDPKCSDGRDNGCPIHRKKQGKILHIGVSDFTKEQMEEAEKYCAIEVYQPQYSMVDRK